MNPIERAARALCELEGNPPGATMDGKPLWQDYVPEVRAVLAAIREPSEHAVEGGSTRFRGIGLQTREAVTQAWGTMIDALLAEEP